MKRKAVIYTRVSTDEQKENGFSLQDQEARLKKYCKENEYEVIKHYQEDHSAKNFNRPRFNEFLAHLKDKKIKPDLFICVRMDRFSRNVHESLNMLTLFKKNGIEFKVVEGNYDLETPENLIPFVLNMLLPQVENERRGLNTKRGMRQAKREGRWVGTPPKGYTSIKNTKGTPQLILNDEAPFIKEAFCEVNKGINSIEQIRLDLKKKGFICSKNQFYNILRNVVYTGQIKIDAWKDEAEEIVEGAHEPIIPTELFYQVQDLLNGRKKKPVKISKINEYLPLRGHLMCPQCGNTLTGSASKNRIGNLYYYYHCQDKYGCKTRFKAAELNSIFTNYLSSYSMPDDFARLYLFIMEDLFKNDDKLRFQEINSLNKEIEKLKGRTINARELFIDNKLSSEDYNETKGLNDDKIRNLNSRKLDLELVDGSFKKYLRFGVSLMNNLPGYFNDANAETKHKMTGLLFPKKLTFDGEKYQTQELNPLLNISKLKVSDLEAIKSKRSTEFADLYYKAPPLGLEPRTP